MLAVSNKYGERKWKHKLLKLPLYAELSAGEDYEITLMISTEKVFQYIGKEEIVIKKVIELIMGNTFLCRG